MVLRVCKQCQQRFLTPDCIGCEVTTLRDIIKLQEELILELKKEIKLLKDSND